jgi:DNA-directed RNA polymerase subunit RPC12/RpoP
VFVCLECGNEYSFRKNNQKELDLFVESLKWEKSGEIVGCPKCVAKIHLKTNIN